MNTIQQSISAFAIGLQVSLFVTSIPQPERSEVEWSASLAEGELGLLANEACEFRLPDGTRVDIYDASTGIAWEVEWAKKADAAFGQSARYANVLGCDPGVWLLIETGDDEYFLRSLLSLNELTENGKVIHFRWTNTRTGITTVRGME